MDKYYQLTEEEIHIGFIYYREDDPYGHKSKSEVTRDWSWRHYEKYSEEFFGKFLDREDIEGEGWNFDIEVDKALLFQKEGKFRRGRMNVCILYNPVSKWLLVWYGDRAKNLNHTIDYREGNAHIYTTNVIFAGEVKNISEFRKTLKQVGV